MQYKPYLSLWLAVLCCLSCGVDAHHFMEKRLRGLRRSFRGEVGYAVKNVTTGEGFYFNQESVFPAASLIKLFVAAKVFSDVEAKRLDLSQEVEVNKENYAPGSGILKEMESVRRLSLEDLLKLMLASSDNTAYNQLLDEVSINSVNEFIANRGFKNTRVNKKVGTSSSLSTEFGIGETSALDVLNLLEMIARDEICRGENGENLRNIFFLSEKRLRLGRLIPDSVWVGGKTGTLRRVRNDACLIMLPGGTVGMVVLTRELMDSRLGVDNEAHVLASKLGWLMYLYFKNY